LADLAAVPLRDEAQQLLDRAASISGGSKVWRARKLAEARDLIALAQIAPRMRVIDLDLREALRAMIRLRVPVATRKGPHAPVEITDDAVLGLLYREESMRAALPGFAFIQVLEPRHCWSASISPDVVQALCLGASLPANIRCRDLVVMSFFALSMQSLQIDVFDSAGVMNAPAAAYWQENIHRVPLTRAPFLSDCDP
jgi:hypothetical protein